VPTLIADSIRDASPRHASGDRGGVSPQLNPWLRIQVINVGRHWQALRPFDPEEFGKEAASPSEAHIQTANALIRGLQKKLLSDTHKVRDGCRAAMKEPTTRNLSEALANKEHAHRLTLATEKVWDFYFELFGQRQSKFGDMLLGCDRIALDCYQVVFTNLGKPKSVPAPPPFVYVKTGFSPATYKAGIRLSKLGRQINPFALIQLPIHRMANPWALGAVLHEVSHNLQNDLNLERAIPLQVGRALLKAGVPRAAAMTWVRWNRETFADLTGLLLGGPEFVPSLMDVVGRSVPSTLMFVPGKPHPTPYLRVLLSIELLKRMGFEKEATELTSAWKKMYPNPQSGTIPRQVLDTAEVAIPAVVQAMAYHRFPELGNRALAEMIRFDHTHQAMVEEAAHRFSKGLDPGVIPARFLIGATRFALNKRLASPAAISKRFYDELARR
jgi:hypothetical protein